MSMRSGRRSAERLHGRAHAAETPRVLSSEVPSTSSLIALQLEDALIRRASFLEKLPSRLVDCRRGPARRTT